MEDYKICSRCIMTNNGDETITFDENGVCNYCTQAVIQRNTQYFPNEEGERRLNKMLDTIKEYGKGRKYDCLMGISGGLDSAYLAYLGTQKWNLRILAVHIDDGFDTELAKQNIEKLAAACNVELNIIRPDEKAFNDLLLSYFKASVPNLAVPQDNVLFSAIYKFAEENDIKYFLSGHNFALESILQKGNTYHCDDVVNIKTIHKKFGTNSIDSLPIFSWKDKRRISKKLKIESLWPLDLIPYNKQKAIDELEEFCGFKYYEAKHFESVFTRFLQTYYLPKKFHVDKRTSHLSSLIIDGQMTRDEALEIMSRPPISPQMLEDDIAFIIKKFDITRDEFDEIMSRPPMQHTDYKTDKMFKIYLNLYSLKKKLKGAFRKGK